MNSQPHMMQRSMGPPPVLGLNSGPFMQNPPQQPQPPGMVMSQNPGPAPMGMLNNAAPNPNGNPQRYPVGMQHGGGMMASRHNMHPRAPANGPMMHPGQPNGNMGGMSNQGMNFTGMLPQNGNPMRRVPSGSINPGLNPMQPNHPNPMQMGMPPHPTMEMSMNASNSMPAHLRGVMAQQNQPQPQMRQMPPSGMPEMGNMGMRGQPGPQHGVRQGNMQMMPGFQSSGMPPVPPNSFPIPPGSRQMSPRPSQPHLTNNTTAPMPNNQMGHSQSENDFFIPPAGFPPGPGPTGPNRMPNANPPQFGFGGPSTPPNPMPNIETTHNTSSPSRPPNQGFTLTPAQAFENMRFEGHTNGVPPRPPSHQSQHPSQMQPPPLHHGSPLANDPYSSPRPPSQPPARPDSRPGPSHTPRPQPPNATGPMPPNRGGPSQNHVPQPPLAPGPLPTRQPQAPPPQPPPPTSAQPGQLQNGPSLQPSPSSTARSPSDHQSVAPASIPRGPLITMPLGNGQGLTRLLQFSGNLASEKNTEKKFQLSWWNELIQEYFTPNAVMKFRLWRGNVQTEAKQFDIGVPILPRFFLVTTQAGVQSMTLTLDGARERLVAQHHAVVECVGAVWTYRYTNGYTVMLRGPLTAHVVITSAHPPGSTPPSQPSDAYQLRFDELNFDALHHDKYLSVDQIVGQRESEAPSTPRMLKPPTPGGPFQGDESGRFEEPRMTISSASIPGEPVNGFGIPQATMRCLELSESVTAMTDLITYSNESKLGPKDALAKMAKALRESGEVDPLMPHFPQHVPSQGPSSFAPYNPFTSFAPSPAVTLYSSAPSTITNPSSTQTNSTMSSPQNAPLSTQNSPQKQHKTIPNAHATGSSAPVPSSSSAPGSTGNTPALTNTTLKRKQGSEASPTTTTSEPLPKRSARNKRGRP